MHATFSRESKTDGGAEIDNDYMDTSNNIILAESKPLEKSTDASIAPTAQDSLNRVTEVRVSNEDSILLGNSKAGRADREKWQ